MSECVNSGPEARSGGPEVARPRVTRADAVLDAAAARLATHGVAATTVDDVAEEAGVSRATVYRYVGNKNEIIGAVIARETRDVLDRLTSAVADAPDVATLIRTLVSTAVVAIDESPVLARLSGDDLRETLAFITIDSASLVDGVVEALAPAIEATGRFGFDPADIELALEESTRLVLGHLTTPRRSGSRLPPDELGARAATMITPLLGS